MKPNRFTSQNYRTGPNQIEPATTQSTYVFGALDADDDFGVRPAKVLLADDDPAILRFISRALQRNGYAVYEAENGQAAVDIAEVEQPDMAIVDLRMPKLDGFEVVKRLKAMGTTELPVLVLSGMDEQEERVAAFDVGADDFVAKPVYLPELMKRVDAFERNRRAFLELQRANERADRLRVFATEAAALLAHDLNNGLGIANANLHFLAAVLELDEEPLDALQATERALRRMIGLVRNFVDISRLEDAVLKPNWSDVEVCDLLQSIAKIHESNQAARPFTIELSCPDILSARFDPVLVERIIHNLLTNATRYVNPGGTIEIRAEMRQIGSRSVLVLHVGNTGATIAPEMRDVLFTKYRTGKDKKSQRGMGLYFCRLAAEAHGGSIAVVDDDKMPVMFCIKIPQPQ